MKKGKGVAEVRLAIVGTGGMAGEHARRFRAIPGVVLAAAADIDAERVRAFAAEHGVGEAYRSLDELLARARVDAVAVVTPDPFHAPLAIQAARAGKHVLCEKPLALDARAAAKMLAAVRQAGVRHVVNFSYRGWPAIHGVADFVRAGGIGEVRHVEASYLQAWLVSKAWGDWRTSPTWLWRLSSKHGSRGVLGDVGVHILDFASYPVGPIAAVSAKLATFPKAPRNRIGPYRLDANDSAVITVEFANGALGVVHTSRWVGGHANRLFLKIAGTKGTVELDSERSTTGFRVCDGAGLDTATWREVEAPPTRSNYERFIDAIRSGGEEQPDFARGLEIQKVLDACFLSDARSRPVRLRA